MGPVLHPSFIVDGNGERSAVVLSMKEFEELSELLEDLDDIIEIAKRGETPTIPHAEILAELARDANL